MVNREEWNYLLLVRLIIALGNNGKTIKRGGRACCLEATGGRRRRRHAAKNSAERSAHYEVPIPFGFPQAQKTHESDT